jgi:hypothetical protein
MPTGRAGAVARSCPESSAIWVMVAVVGPCGQHAALSTGSIVGASGRHAQRRRRCPLIAHASARSSRGAVAL